MNMIWTDSERDRLSKQQVSDTNPLSRRAFEKSANIIQKELWPQLHALEMGGANTHVRYTRDRASVDDVSTLLCTLTWLSLGDPTSFWKFFIDREPKSIVLLAADILTRVANKKLHLDISFHQSNFEWEQKEKKFRQSQQRDWDMRSGE